MFLKFAANLPALEYPTAEATWSIARIGSLPCGRLSSRIRALKPELEELAGEAKAAASEAGRELTRAFTARSEAILDELKGLRVRLENDIALYLLFLSLLL